MNGYSNSYTTILKLGLIVALLLTATLLKPSMADALSLDLAATLSQPSLKIKSANNNSVLAEMVDQASIWPSITLKTEEQYIGDSNFGYSTEAMAWYMRLNRQKVNNHEVNLGTSARGYFAYLTPSIYYRFGDKYSMDSSGWMTTVGVGLGVGYLNVKGTMMTTGTTPSTLQNINHVGFGVSTGLFIEVMKNRWFFRLSSFGPALNNGSHKLELSDTSIKIGRRFSLDLF